MGKTVGGVDMGAELLSAFGEDADNLVLVRRVPAGDGNAIDGPPVTVDGRHDCLGYPEAVVMSRVDKTLIRDKMRVFGIYGASLDVEPQTDDILRFGHEAYVIYSVGGDSVGGVFVVYAQHQGRC